MDNIEARLLKNYEERESSTTYYDLLKKVTPNPMPAKLLEKITKYVVTEKGVERVRKQETKVWYPATKKIFPQA
jgi:hypothetical protein